MPRDTGRGEDSDTYLIDGEEYPSVTRILHTVLDDAFGAGAYWGAKLGLSWTFEQDPDLIEEVYTAFKASEFDPNKTRNRASERGKQAHALLEHLVQDPDSADLENMMVDGLPIYGYDLGVLRWFKEQYAGRSSLVACEEKVYSKTHKYAGTLDLARIVAEETSWPFQTVDLKTHKGDPRFGDLMQIGAYGGAYAEMHSCGDPDQLVVVVHEDGTYTESDSWVDPRVFLNIKAVYDEIVTWKQSA